MLRNWLLRFLLAVAVMGLAFPLLASIPVIRRDVAIHRAETPLEAYLRECIHDIRAAQNWVQLPPSQGGPTTPLDFSTLDFSMLGRQVPSGILSWTNYRGDVCVISARGVNTFTYTYVSSDGLSIAYLGVTATYIPFPTIIFPRPPELR